MMREHANPHYSIAEEHLFLHTILSQARHSCLFILCDSLTPG